jgi:uncharacterized membrane protein YhfC
MNLSIWIILPGLGATLIAVAFTIFAQKRGCPWSYMGMVALAWIIATAIKYLVAPHVTPLTYQFLYVPDKVWAPGSMSFYIYVGIFTALTEVLLTWLVLRYTRLGHVTWSKALAFGIGFGVIEALYQGVPSLVSNISALVSPMSISAETMINLQLLNNPLFGLGPGTDRFFATLIHIFANVLLFYGVVSKQNRWLWIAFAYKCVVDAVAAFGMFWGVETVSKLWRLEVVLWVLGFTAWWGINQIRLRYAVDKTNYPVAISAAPVRSNS